MLNKVTSYKYSRLYVINLSLINQKILLAYYFFNLNKIRNQTQSIKL